MVRVEHVMGTVICLHVRDDVPARAVDAVFAWFHDVDERFSTFKPGSEVSRITAGTLERCAWGPDLLEVTQLCEQVQRASHGAFDAWQTRDGRRRFDPSAVVKGWSVDRAATMLWDAGARTFSLNAGGDVLVRGAPAPGRRWRVGIRHPHDAQMVAAVLAVSDLTVATSGSYERGGHITDPRTGVATTELLSMTVAGPTLALADAYSTAAYVMGREGVAWVASLPGYHAYAITADMHAVYTPGFAELLATADNGAALAPAQ